MWNRQKKTSREGKLMNPAQRQAWIENWTIWALQGMIGVLTNIVNQARSNRVHFPQGLVMLKLDMKDIISNIKADQDLRKALRKNLP